MIRWTMRHRVPDRGCAALFSIMALLAAAASVAASPEGVTLVAPQDAAEIRLADPGRGVVVFEWTADPDAAGYRLVISKTRDLSRPVVRRKVDQPLARVQGLPAGKYYWRVESVVGDGRVESTSRVNTFSIASGAP